ncbi:MAG: lipopolysaccharide biosynthesis protein [Candidatus Binatus sp.]
MRTIRFILTIASREAYTIVMVVIGLFATPLILRWLGDERFGAFQVATDWMAYLALLEFGLGGALMPLIALSEARHEEKSVHDLMVSGVRSYTKVALASVVAVVILAVLATRLIPVQARYASDLRYSFLIGGFGVLMTPLAPFRALMEGRQQGYWLSVFLTAQSITITAGSLVLAWAGWGITGQSIAVVAGAAVFNAALLWLCRSEVPSIFIDAIKGPAPEAARSDVRKLNAPTFVLNLCGRVSLLTDNIVVSGLLSPALVTPFVLTQRLTSLAQRELQTIGNASWAALAELSAQGRKDVFSRRLLELTRVVAVIGLAALIPIVAFNRQFVWLWVGRGRYAGDLITALAAANALMQAIFSLWGWCVTGTGQIRRIIPMTIVQAVLNLVLSIAFTFAFGLAGPLLGTTAAFLAVSVWYMPMLMSEMFDVPTSSLVFSVGAPLALALPYAAVVDWLVRSYGATGWIGIAYQMSAAAAVYLMLAWLVVFHAEDRASLLSRFRLVFRAATA